MTTNKAEQDKRWHDAWQIGVPPGRKWDIGKPAPALIQFLDSGYLPMHGKLAYVPGCGRGYDVVELAKRGAGATGLDLAPEAVGDAKKYLQAQAMNETSGTASFVAGDFFVWKTDQQWVDFGYDSTFFCALHPTMRQDWARAWGKLIKIGGCLVTLEFPIRPDDKTGPPWPVSHQIYTELLTPLGFKNVYYREVDQTSLSHPHLAGGEIFACWQRICQALQLQIGEAMLICKLVNKIRSLPVAQPAQHTMV